MMQEFRIGPEGIKTLRRLIIRRMLIFVPILLIIAVINGFRYWTDKSAGPGFGIIVMVGILLLFGLFVFRVITKNERLFKSYVLTMENILIKREQWNTPDVDIYFNKILEVRKTKNGWLIVKGKYAGDVIIIPSQIENFEQVEQKLQEIVPITTKITGTFYEKYRLLIRLVSLIAMIVALVVENKFIAGFCAGLFSVLTIKNYIELRKNKNIDNRVRRNLW